MIETTNFQPSMEHAAGEAPTVKARIPAGDALAEVRRHALRLARFGALPWQDAEDLAADMIGRALAEARTVPGRTWRPTDMDRTRIMGRDTGTPADVLAWIDRAEAEAPKDAPTPLVLKDRTRSAYVQLEARAYRRRVLARRLAEATEDGTLPDMESEDFTEAEAEAPRPMSPAGAYIEALRLCRLAELPDSCREALAQGLYPGDAADLARALGIPAGTWRNRVSAGAKLCRDHYPDPGDLADLIDRNVCVRTRPLAARRIGADLPKDRHRTPAQMDREAAVLIARPTRPGRAPTVAKLPDTGARVLPAPADWSPAVRRVDYFLPAEALRRIAEHLAVADLSRRGARPHRQAPGFKAAGYSPAPAEISRPGTDAFIRRPARVWKLRDGTIGADRHRSMRAWEALARDHRRRQDRSRAAWRAFLAVWGPWQ